MDKTSRFAAAAAIAALLMPAAAQAQSGFLGKLLGSLAQPGQQPRTNTLLRGAAVNEQSAEQKAAQARALATPLQSLIAADRAEAGPLISRIVTTSACAVNDTAWNQLNREAEHPLTHTADFNNFSAINGTKFHPKNRCLDVIRVSNWSKPAKNAMSFRVELISAQSDEAKHQDFTLIKDDQGQWLIRTIGVAYL